MDQQFDDYKLKISDIKSEQSDGNTTEMKTEDPDDAPLMSEFEIECFDSESILTQHLKIHTSSEESVSDLIKEDSIDTLKESVSDTDRSYTEESESEIEEFDLENEITDFKIIKCKPSDDKPETELNEGRSSWLTQLTGKKCETDTEHHSVKCKDCNKDACECLKIKTGECSLCFKKHCWIPKVADTDPPICSSCNPENVDPVGDESLYCSICRRFFKHFHTLVLHLRTHREEEPCRCEICQKKLTAIRTPKKPFVCSYQNCPKSYTHKSALNNHIKVVHSIEQNKFQCSICGKSFSNKGNVNKHMQIHRGGGQFGCEVCHKRFSERGHLNEHVRIHTGEKPYVCPVQTCLKAFRLKRSFIKHTKKGHTSKNQETDIGEICSICGASFTHIDTFKSHLESHNDETPFECVTCHKTFTTKTALENHEETHIEDRLKLYQCSVCEKRFEFQRFLTRHMVIHTGEKPFECDICHKRFTQKASLTYHGKCHGEERPFVCSYHGCLKTFKHKKTLNMHKKFVHAKEMKLVHQLYPCTICRKTFSSKKNVNRHMRIHTGERQFECEVCRKRFSEQRHLNDHTRIHTGEKPYVCSVPTCLMAFRIKRTLDKHTKTCLGDDCNTDDIDMIIKCETETQLIGETSSSQLNQQTDVKTFIIHALKPDTIKKETFNVNNDHNDIDDNIIKYKILKNDANEAEIQIKEEI